MQSALRGPLTTLTRGPTVIAIHRIVVNRVVMNHIAMNRIAVSHIVPRPRATTIRGPAALHNRSLRVRKKATLLTSPPFCYVRCPLRLSLRRFVGRPPAAKTVYRSFTAIS
jgi:hypothetical protein